MGITEAQKKATYKYRENYTELRVRVTYEERDKIKEYCSNKNISVSEYLRNLIEEDIKKAPKCFSN